tara:strand:+ start:341 stop:604 length:264 start_codon:yes stop_codon:yes gene_type:complete
MEENMKVKDMIEMLKLADKDSEVMLEVRNKDMNGVGYFKIGSDWAEYGGYSPDELDYFESINEPKSKAMVELTLNIDEWVKLGIETN